MMTVTLGKSFKILALAVCILFLISSDTVVANAAVYDGGSLQLNKTARQITDNTWEVQLEVSGTDYKATTDIVLLTDVSNSMNYDMSGNNAGTSRISYVRTAVKEFISKLITPDGLNRIAVVTFAKIAEQKTGFSNDLSVLNAAADNLTAKYEGTNIQSGLHKAYELFESSNAVNKAVVILGDGSPTYAYQITSSSGVRVYEQNRQHLTQFDDDYTLGFNYNKTVGSGTENSQNTYYLYCTDCSRRVNAISDFSVPSVYEASLIKSNQIDIYSIAFGADSKGEQTLKDLSSEISDGSVYYTKIPGDTDESEIQSLLNDTFLSIGSSIISCARDSYVSDPMGTMFDIADGGSNITVSQGDFQLEDNGRTIHWNVGTIQEGVPAIMTYTVQIHSDAENGVLYPTNGTTLFYYKNYLGQDACAEFPIPEVSVVDGMMTIHKTGDMQDNETSLFRVSSDSDTFTVFIHGCGSCTVRGLTIGKKYTVTEITDLSWKYDLKSSNDRMIIISEDENRNILSFENRTENDMLSDENYIENQFAVYQGGQL